MAPRRTVAQKQQQLAALATAQNQSSDSPDKSALLHLKAELRVQQARNAALYQSLRVQRRQYQCTLVKLQSLNEKYKNLKRTELLETDTIATDAIQLLDNVIAENAQLEAQLVQATQMLADSKELDASTRKENMAALKSDHKEHMAILKSSHKEQLHALRACNRSLQKAVTCTDDIKANAYKRGFEEGKKAKSVLRLIEKGIYTPKARSLARTLVSAGCATKHIGLVIRAVCAAAGLTVKGNISSRTAARSVLEGGIAAKIQVGHDLGVAKSG